MAALLRSVLLAASLGLVAATCQAQQGLRLDPRELGWRGGFSAWSAYDAPRASVADNVSRYALLPPTVRIGERGGFGLAYSRGREADALALSGYVNYEPTNFSLYGHYFIAPAWALSAEASQSDGAGVQPRHLFRFGLHRQF